MTQQPLPTLTKTVRYIRHKKSRLFLLCCLLANSLTLQGIASSDWYVLKQDGHTIGKIEIQQHYNVFPLSTVETDVHHISTIDRFGAPFTVDHTSHFTEDLAGYLPLSYRYRLTVGKQAVVDTSDVFATPQPDSKANSTNNGKALPFLFPSGKAIEKKYQDHINDAPGQTFSFKTLHFGLQPAWVNTVVTSLQNEQMTLSTGQQETVKKFKLINQEAQNNPPVYEWRNLDGKLLKAKTEYPYNLEMLATYPTMSGSDGALKEQDIVQHSVIPTSIIPFPEEIKEAKYRLTGFSDRPLSGQSIIPEDDRQHWQARQATEEEKKSLLTQTTFKNATLHIRTSTPKHVEAINTPYYQQQSKLLENTLQSGSFIEASDPQITAMAKRIAAEHTNSHTISQLLRKWVYTHIHNKTYSEGFQSAKTTFDSQSGDCTEHAVLLAALARSLGMPTRIVYGLVYQPAYDQASTQKTAGQFVFHLWNEVYLGGSTDEGWYPLDASRSQNMVDATHIKMGVSPLNTLSDLQAISEKVFSLMNKIQIEVLHTIGPGKSVFSLDDEHSRFKINLEKHASPPTDSKTSLPSQSKRHRISIDLASSQVKRHNLQNTREFYFPNGKEERDTEDYSVILSEGLEKLSESAGQANKLEKAQEKLRLAIQKTQHSSLKSYLLGERLTSVGLFTWANQAFKNSTQESQTYTSLIDDWQALYFPNPLLPPDVEAEITGIMLKNTHGMTTEQQQSAITTLENHLAQYPTHDFLYRILAAISNQKATVALQLLDKAIQTAPGHPVNHEKKGDILLSLKHYGAALQHYKKAAKLFNSNHHALQAVKPWPKLLHQKTELSEALYQTSTNSHSASSWFKLSKALSDMARPAESLEALQKATALSPNNPLYQFKLALRQEDWIRCTHLTSAMESLAGSQPEAVTLLAQYYIHVRHYRQAERILHKGIHRFPKDGELAILMDQVYQHQITINPEALSVKKALYPLERGIKHQANNLSTLQEHWANWVLLSMVNNHDISGLQAVENMTEQLLNNNPLSTEALTLRARVLSKKGEYKTASQLLEKVSILEPESTALFFAKAQLAIDQQDWNTAMYYYRLLTRQAWLNGVQIHQYQELASHLNQFQNNPHELKIYLSEDEFAALGQINSLSQQVYNDVDTWQALVAGNGTITLSVEGIQATQQFATKVSQQYQNTLALYNLLNEAPIPKRMATYYQNALSITYHHLLHMKTMFTLFPTLQFSIADTGLSTPAQATDTKPESLSQETGHTFSAAWQKMSSSSLALQQERENFFNQVNLPFKKLLQAVGQF